MGTRQMIAATHDNVYTGIECHIILFFLLDSACCLFYSRARSAQGFMADALISDWLGAIFALLVFLAISFLRRPDSKRTPGFGG